MNIEEYLKNDLKELIESPIEFNNKIIGWHVTAILKSGSLGGGVHFEKNEARRIAIAEILERKIFNKIFNSTEKHEYLLDEYPTTCGFAAGFDDNSTRIRALCEAVERWAWSKWIDDGFMIPDYEVNRDTLSPIAKKMLSVFEDVKFLILKIDSSNFTNFPREIYLGIVLGSIGNGVFPGSRVASRIEDLWEHASVEAWRHSVIASHQESYNKNVFPFNRIIAFSKLRNDAFTQIQRSSNPNWPQPKIRLEKRFKTDVDSVFIWRCLLEDFIGWEKGSETRFVY